MATSSIFANFNITDSVKAENFVNALDISAAESPKKQEKEKGSFIELPSEIKALWKKRKDK